MHYIMFMSYLATSYKFYNIYLFDVCIFVFIYLYITKCRLVHNFLHAYIAKVYRATLAYEILL